MIFQLMGTSTGTQHLPVQSGWSYACVESTTMEREMSTVLKQSVLKKLKTNKNKFFVLHKNSPAAPARLEYFDSESHWNKKKKPKRIIDLENILSVNAFSDKKVEYGIVIFTKVDSFQLGFETEQTRDMWLADMRLLSSSSSSHGHSTVEHVWQVIAQTRSMRSSFEGEYKLCLNEEQASLISMAKPTHSVELPLTTITHCVVNNRYFAIEVGHSASTGPGEIWMELEDSLIAQHVHRAFKQNWSSAISKESSVRPVSRSLSFKDKNAALKARLRSGSESKLRSKIGHALSRYSSLASSATNFSGSRDRSDSVGSQSTTTSLSAEESDSHNWNNESRSGTPDLRQDSNYMLMNVASKPEDKCLSSSSSLCSAAADSCSDKTQDKNSNYMDMSGKQSSREPQDSSRSDAYIDMTVGTTTPPSDKGCTLKQVKCYLTEGNSPTGSTRSELFPKAKPQTDVRQTSEYVEMCRRHMLTDRDKSSSAPHLMPPSLHQQHHVDPELFMSLEFDSRERTASMSCTHRPRGSSWSQFVRPRSSTEYKRRSRNQRASSKDIVEMGKDYIDMTHASNNNGGYVQMSLDKNAKQKLELVKSFMTEKDDKENMPLQPSPRIPSLVVAHPFPELLSASSEDDVSMNSADGVSLHSLTSSADSMSTSSHSSHHSSAFPSLEAEPYVAMHTSPVPMTANSYIRSSTHRLIHKPARVPSYIVDELRDTNKPSNHSDYMEMSPNGR